MDLVLVKRVLDLSRRKKKWIILGGLFGLSGYGAYKVYNLPSVERKRMRLLKLLGAFMSVAETVSDSSDAIGVVSKDLKEFLQSDSDEIPTSLKQLSKMARSDEFLKSLSRATEAMAVGVLRGYSTKNHLDQIDEVKGSDLTDRVMDKLMSSAGTGFASALVGSFAKNLVLGFYENSPGGGNGNDQAAHERLNSSMDGWIELMCDDKCRGLMADCIQTFVSSAVSVYLDKTMNINVYDEVFSAITNHKHQAKVSDLLVSICNGAVETLVKTSHHVLTASKSEPGSSTNAPSKSDSLSLLNDNLFDQEDEPLRKINKTAKGNSDFQSSGWVNTVSSTLAVPSNRKFVLDVTGRVTFESIRSIVEFVYWKLSDGIKGSVSTAREDATEKGREVIRYVGAKSFVILTICLALILHFLAGTRALLPA